MERAFFYDLHGNVIVSENDLPAVDCRWTENRKFIVIKGVAIGIFSRELVLERYGMTETELDSWTDRMDRLGQDGLKTTRIRSIR